MSKLKTAAVAFIAAAAITTPAVAQAAPATPVATAHVSMKKPYGKGDWRKAMHKRLKVHAARSSWS